MITQNYFLLQQLLIKVIKLILKIEPILERKIEVLQFRPIQIYCFKLLKKLLLHKVYGITENFQNVVPYHNLLVMANFLEKFVCYVCDCLPVNICIMLTK